MDINNIMRIENWLKQEVMMNDNVVARMCLLRITGITARHGYC